jgi:capsular polysaccharide biosynthesis protein
MSVLARWKPIVAAVALGLVAAFAYLALAEERYAAEAKLQVVPLPAADTTFSGFALPRAPGAGSAAETVADLVERPAVVDAAAVRLRLDREEVLDALSVSADRSSNVVTVRAETDDPRRAAQLANAVADEFVAERSAAFQGEVNRTIGDLRDRLRDVPASERDPAVVSRLAALQASLGERDPTVRVAGNAVARERTVSPRPLPVLAAALASSLVLGLAVAAALAAAGRPSTPEGAALAKREAALARRVKVVTERERALARRAGEVAKRERQLERPSGIPVPPPREPEPIAPSSARALRPGTWNVVALERLVAERGDEFPDRVEEWRSYVFFLREHASPEGVLPVSFDALVEETFRELVQEGSSEPLSRR